MRGPVEESGATVEEAIEAALAKLGATEDEVEVRILSEGGAIPGQPAEPARVFVKMRDEGGGDGPPEPSEQSAPPPPDALNEQAEAAADFLDDLLDIIDLDVDVEIDVGPEDAIVELVGDDLALLIGRHGATLDALQDLMRAAVKNRLGVWPQVTLDAEGYHARRAEMLEARAHTVADKVRRTGKPESLPSMNASERKVIHEVLADVPGVRTESAGQGLDRHVVVFPE